MTIVFVAPFMTTMLRGIERCVYELGSRLADRGHDVHLLYWPGPYRWPYGQTGPRLFLHQLPLLRYYQHVTAGLLYPLYLQRLKPDIVNFFYSWQGEDIAHAFWVDRRAASILHLQYPAQQVPARYAQLGSSRTLRRAQACVACSHYVAAGVQRLLKREPHVIPNGVDVDSFCPPEATTKACMRSHWGLADDRPILCTVGALEERKGVGRVLEALALLQRRGERFYYLVVGEGPFRSHIERFVAGHHLADSVILVGAHADPRPFYHVADAFVFLARGEAFGLAPLEAMASTLPIVAARQPPLNEFVPEEGALFVDETAPGAVADTLIALLNDPQRARAMGEFNRAYARRHYSWDRVVGHYDALFQNVMQQAGPL
jgi:glycosyltransferase involved in cell wall biosynthesis